MTTFYDYAVPIFLLVFLIITILVFLWIDQRQANLQLPIEPQKPIYSTPLKPLESEATKEGFQVVDRSIVGVSFTGPLPTGVSGSRDGGSIFSALSGSQKKWPSQFDLSPTAQALYGNWGPPTLFDKYYDDYEQAEIDAGTAQLLKFNSAVPVKSEPPDFGSALGAFDSDTTRIPWDKDNESYKQTDVVWGYVSEQASRSIYLKTYVNQIAAASASFIPCGETDPANYCYKSPLMGVTVKDPNVAALMKTADAVVQAIGTLPMMFLSEINADMSNFTEVKMARQKAIGGFFESAKTKSSHPLGRVDTVTTKAGNALGLGVGARKVLTKMGGIKNKVRVDLRANIAAVNEKVSTGKAGIMGSFTLAATAAGLTAAYNPLYSPIAATLTALAIAVDLFFGVFAGIMMAVEAIVDPIINSLLESGGDCPGNYRPITELVPTEVLTALSALIPLFPFLQMFDPYVCWGTDSNGLANVRLKIPPKVPPFMIDRTLSLVYHAAWQTGNNPNIPSPTSLSFMLDPLEPGYVWLEQSDLANNPNVNELTQLATSMANLAQAGAARRISAQQSSGSKLPSNIAVKTCLPNTTPSPDGRECVQNQRPNSSVPAVLAPCAAGQHDDKYNCWNARVDANCTGGNFTFETTNTWNDSTGYLRLITTPLICDGVEQTNNTNIAVRYMDRLTCPDSAYPERLSTELLCFARCPEGYAREGALCKGTQATYTREYKFVGSTMYRQQTFNPNVLNELSDVTIPYCDFSKPYMLNKMAQFYYNNSLQNPIVNEDGTIQVQMITMFYGVIASSELSCDVVCSIDYITYDPITGGNYTSYTGCSYPEDEAYEACSFCYRRFYFIRTGQEVNRDEFTVTGCTWADYTAPDAMVQSDDVGTNPVQSLPKKFTVARKEGSIVNYQRLAAEWASGQVMRQASVGLLDAGLSIAGGMMGGAGGGKAGAAVGNQILGRTVREGAQQIATRTATIGATKGASEAAEASSKVAMGNIVNALKNGGDEGIESATRIARQSGMNPAEAAAFVANAAKSVRSAGRYETGLSVAGGLIGGTGAGLFSSMYLNPLLQRAWVKAVEPEGVSGAANTFITGKDMKNLQVVTNNNWWTVNQGAIYELAEGYVPTLRFCENAKISSSHCAHKYVVRDMVNRFHNEFERFHIKEITGIEPRGVDGCYYKLNVVDYTIDTNTEASVLQEKEIILSHVISDYATCTFKPTEFTTEINSSLYPVRSYIDPSTASLPTPRVIYPTRNTVYTSDLFARYVRVRPPLTTTGDGLLNLAQISVFDISGFNISVQMPTMGTSTADGAASSDAVVNGTLDQGGLLGTVWQPGSAGPNEYWEVDLSNNKNISEVIYFGATGADAVGRNRGVRIEFLYTNGANDAPIVTYTLPNDESTQLISMSSSSYLTPTFPLSGVIKIPRPIAQGKALGLNLGCMNKCEDKAIMDSLIQQHNENPDNTSTIIKILRAITPNSTTCEYEAQVITTDVPAEGSSQGSSEDEPSIAKNSVSTQILSMQLAPVVQKGYGKVMARYLRILPSGTDKTYLEFSKIIVRSSVRSRIDPTDYSLDTHPIVSTGQPINYTNMYYELEGIYSKLGTEPAGPNMAFLTKPPINYNGDYRTIPAETYPFVFRGSDTTLQTYFQLDLMPPQAAGSGLSNYEIYDIAFVGAADRSPGGIRAIKIELFSDRPDDVDNCCNKKKYPPVFEYYLPTDEINQRILVEPPSVCSFRLTQTDVLKTPTFLQPNVEPLSTPDTSGGVFSFTSVVDSVKNAWSSLMPLNPESAVKPIKDNLRRSDEILHTMLDTIAADKRILTSSSKCSDPDILKLMMTGYNIHQGAPIDGDYGVTKHVMTRILKAGQSTPSTCDILFEDLEEYYDQYIVDITDKSNITKSIKSARMKFVMNAAGKPVPDLTSIVYDISSNALGILSSKSTLSPVYTGPTCPQIECGNPVQINAIASMFSGNATSTPTTTKRKLMTGITHYFPNSPLSCEYRITKVVSTTSKATGSVTSTSPVSSFIKAIFKLDTDGCTPLLSSVVEYDPEFITHSQDMSIDYLNKREVTLPSLYGYEPAKLISKRVNSG